ncbi:MAG TPA: hypothetical protein VF913_01180, partial [Xanthobacteraceae bacterium]
MAGSSLVRSDVFLGHRRERFGKDLVSKRDFMGTFKHRAGLGISCGVTAGLPAQQPGIDQGLANAGDLGIPE